MSRRKVNDSARRDWNHWVSSQSGLNIWKLLRSDSKFGQFLFSRAKRYNHSKYWARRAIVVNPVSTASVLLKLWYLYYIKKTDDFYGCSFGTSMNSGASFATPPVLPHGPSGIFVGHDVVVGKDVTIFQQVTLAHGGSVIGDEVEFGAGSKLLAGRNVGEGARVGANCVVVEDVPANATVVLPKPRIITSDARDSRVD